VRLGFIVVLAGCGRIGFAPGPSIGDGTLGSDAATDAIGQVIPSGAKIWLRMETDPNVAIVDTAGGHTGSCTPTCPTLAAALHGQGYVFTDQEIDIQDAPDLDSSAGFSAALWIQLTMLPASLGCVWSKPFNSAAGFDTFTLCIQTDGTVVYDSETQAGVTDAQSGPAIAPGAWHHLAMTWNGSVKRDYLDGVEQAMSTVVLGHGTEFVTLGGEAGQFQTPALVDDAVYYTRALSAPEILQLATP
jgi:Concanavalin A-like lectin/glucanases superfamily